MGADPVAVTVQLTEPPAVIVWSRSSPAEVTVGATGCDSTVTVTTALLTLPALFSAPATNCAPLSASVITPRLQVELVTLPVPVVGVQTGSSPNGRSRDHPTSGAGWPLATALRLTVSPSVTVMDSGDVVKVGATVTAATVSTA